MVHAYQVDEHWFDELHIRVWQKTDDRKYLCVDLRSTMIIIGIVLHFFSIYIDEAQESLSSQAADTAKGRICYVIYNLNLMKKVPDMLFVTEIGIHVA